MDPSQRRETLGREALLLLFLQAYDDGNIEVFGAVLEQAEADPELDALIWDVFPTFLSERGIMPFPEEEKEELLAFLRQPPGK